MTDEGFRASLEALGLTQSSFARRLNELGDPRSFPTVLRSVQNYAGGRSGIPAEIEVILGVMQRWPEVRGTPQNRRAGRPRKPE